MFFLPLIFCYWNFELNLYCFHCTNVILFIFQPIIFIKLMKIPDELIRNKEINLLEFPKLPFPFKIQNYVNLPESVFCFHLLHSFCQIDESNNCSGHLRMQAMISLMDVDDPRICGLQKWFGRSRTNSRKWMNSLGLTAII